MMFIKKPGQREKPSWKDEEEKSKKKLKVETKGDDRELGKVDALPVGKPNNLVR